MLLSDVDEDTFKLYIHWAYMHNIELNIVDTEETCYHSKPHQHNPTCERALESLLLVKLYIAANLLLDTALKRCVMVMHHIQDTLGRGEGPFSWKLVDRVWKNTMPKCALQLCVLIYFRLHTTKKGFTANAEQINSQFLLYPCNQHFHGRDAIPSEDAYKWLKREPCIYHDHDDGENCRT